MIKSITRLLFLPLLCAGLLFPHGVTFAAPDACQFAAAAGTDFRPTGIKYNAAYVANDPFGAINNCEHGMGGLGATDNPATVDILEHPNAVQFNLFRDNTTWGIVKQQVSGANQNNVIVNATATGHLDHIDEREFLAVQGPTISSALPAEHNLSGTLQFGDQVRVYMLVHNNAQQICGAGGNTAQNVQVSIDWDDISGQILGRIQADNMFLAGSGVGTNSITDTVGGISLGAGLSLQKAGPVNIQRQSDPNAFYCNGNPITYTTLTEGTTFPAGNVTYDEAGNSITVNLGNIDGSYGNIHYVYFDLNVVSNSIDIIIDDNDNFDDTQVVNEGDPADFWVQVFNDGTSTLTNVVVTDPETPNCSLTAAQVEYILTNGASGTNPTQLLSFDRGLTLNTNATLESGEGFRYVCDISSVLSTTFPDGDNDISVVATPVAGGANVTDTDPTLVTVNSSPSIEIIKDDNDNNDDSQTVVPGGTATFTVNVINNGTALLNNVVINDAEAPNCARTNAQTQLLIAAIGNNDTIFNPGESFSYVCTATNVQTTTFLDGDNDIDTVATPVSGGANVTDGDASFVIVSQPSVNVVKDDNDNNDDTQTIAVGNTATFSVVVTNDGTADLTNVVITDAEAPSCDRTSAQVQLLLTGVGNNDTIFNPGESFSYICTATNVQTTTFLDGDNDIDVVATPVLGGANVTDTDPSNVVLVQGSVDIVKDDNDNNDDTQTVNVGGTADFSITVTNNGTADLNNVVISDPEAPACDRTAGQTLSLILTVGNNDAIFNPGESFTYTCQATNVQTTTFPDGDNDATANATLVLNGTNVNDTDPSTVVVLVPSIIIDKNDNDNSDDTQTVMQGDAAEFNITITNNGATALENLVVDETENEALNCELTAAETEFILTNGLSGTDPSGHLVSFNRTGLTNTDAILQIGESFSYVCNQTNVQPTTFIDNDNDINVTGDPVGGGTATMDLDDTTVLVTPANPVISIVKDDNDNNDDTQTVNVGGTANFSFTVTNTGNVGLQTVVITDAEAPGCARTDVQTQALIAAVGNNDTILDAGESFTYACSATNVQTTTFLDGDNDSRVDATSVGTGTPVFAEDPSTVVVLVPSIIIDKNDNDNNDDTQTVVAGNAAEFSITVTNNGAVALENVVVDETENEALNCELTQAEVEFILTNGASGTDPSGHLISFDRSGLSNTDAILQIGESFGFVCNQTNVQPTTFTDNDNDIDATGDPVGGGTQTMDLDDTTVVVIAANPSVDIVKDDNDNNDDTQTVLVGGTASFTITVTNNGNLDLNQIVINDAEAPLCARTDVQTQALIAAVGNGDTTLNPGESFTYTCSVANVQTTTFLDGDNDSDVAANVVVTGNPVTDQDPSTVVVQNASVDIDKNDNDNSDDTQTVMVGDTASFTITVTNNGTADLTSVVITDAEAPACARTSVQTQGLISVIGNNDTVFNPGESFSYTCDVTNVQLTTFLDGDNDADVSATPVLGGANVTDTDPSTVVVQNDSINIDKNDNDNNDDTQMVTVGGTASFTITVTNDGTAQLNQVVITDAEAPGCARTDVQTQALIAAVGNNDTTFDPGESFSYTCDATNVQTTTFLDGDNDADISANVIATGGTVTDTDPSTVQVVTPSIQIVKDDNDNNDDTQALVEGDTANFSVVVTNNGTADLNQVVITDAEAPGCARTDVQTQALIAAVGNNDTTFNPGESFSYTCSFVNVTTTTFVDNDNDIDVSANVVASGASTTDIDDTEVLVSAAEPAVNIVKDDNDNSDDTQTVLVGGTASFTITVTNTGNRDLNQVVITDAEAPACARTDAQTQVLIAAVGNNDAILNPGETFTYTCDATNVQTTTFPDGDNDSNVTANVIFNNTPVNSEDPSTVVVQAASVDIDKNDADNSDDTQTVVNGQEASFTITVTNNGTSTLNQVVITDAETPGCARTDVETQALIAAVGNNDATFDPGESFSYICSTVGLGALTFLDGDNDADVSANVILSGTPVTDTDPSTVVFLNGALTIDKNDADNSDDTQNVNLGGTASFTITVTNGGTAAIDGVFVTDAEAPNCALSTANVEYILTAGASGTENTVITNVNATTVNNDAVLDPTESFSYECAQDNVQTTTFTGNQNLAAVSGETVVGNSTVTDDDTSEVLVVDNRVGEIEITKSANPVSGSQVSRADTITYTLTVENIGVLDLVNVEITDQLDTNVTFDPDPQTGINHAAGTVTITVGNLAVGATQSFDFTVKVNDNAAGSINNQGTVTGDDTNNNPVTDTSNIVTHNLRTGGGGGGGGSAPVITAIPVCLEHPITGQLQITEVRPDRFGPNWDFYQDCLNDPLLTEAECVYEWAAYTEYAFPFDNGTCEPTTTNIRPTPFVGTECVDAFACPGCLNNDGGQEPIIEKGVIDPATGTPVDLIAVPVGDEVTYVIKVDLIPLDLNDGFRFIDGTVRVYDFVNSSKSGGLWYRDGLVAGWTRGGDAAAGGIYFEKEVTTDDYNRGHVEFSYVMATDLMSATDDVDQVVNNAFAILRYKYDQEVEDADGVKWYRDFHKTLGLNEEICADSHFELSALEDEISTYGDDATVKIIRPFIQGQGGDIAMTEKVTGNAEEVIEDANAGRVITTDTDFDDQSDDTVFVDEADNFADIDNLNDYYDYLASTATPLDTGARLGEGPNNGLLIVDSGITLQGTYTFSEPTTLIVRGGSVDITGNVTLGGDNFFGVVVLDGTINISDEVTEIQGAYIAEDLDNSGDDGDFKELVISGDEDQLSVDGMLAGNVNDLLEKRRFIGTSPNDPQPNIKLNFDIRMLDATPPGLEKALGTDWGQVE